MSRHPYTFAADYIREIVMEQLPDVPISTPKLSRAEASQIYGVIADVLDMTKEELVIKLSDAYQRAQQP